MKTTAIQFKRVNILLMSALLFAVSCQGQSNSDANEAKPPKVDIHSAIVSDNMEAVKQHIAAGTDLNAKDPMGGSSPLITATVFGKTEIAKLLIDTGVDLGVKNNDGSTALHTAAFFCSPEIVKLLLEKNADKSIRNNYGQTPYETVAGTFKEVKEFYKGIGAMLEPMGLKLDLAYIEQTRPQIAALLK
jgi:uncharacterized protein